MSHVSSFLFNHTSGIRYFQWGSHDNRNDIPVFDSTTSTGCLATPAARDDHHGNEQNDKNQDEREGGRYEQFGQWP